MLFLTLLDWLHRRTLVSLRGGGNGEYSLAPNSETRERYDTSAKTTARSSVCHLLKLSEWALAEKMAKSSIFFYLNPDLLKTGRIAASGFRAEAPKRVTPAG